jgi:molybdopterin synthase catalytic subunit
MTIQAKISERSKKIIREIVHETGESQINIIEHAVLSYHREWRMQKINEAYAKLRKNKRAWKEELEERSVLENTSEDGLEDV